MNDFTALAPKEAMILLIISESDRRLAEDLAAKGFNCHVVFSVEQAFAYLAAEGADVLVAASETMSQRNLHAMRSLVDGYLPVILISDEVNDALVSEFRDVGVDNYLARPVNLSLLQSGVDSALRIRNLYQHEIDQRQQLLNYWQQADMEQEMAAKIYNTVLQSNFLQTDVVKALMSPIALFNGDVLLVTKTPDNHLYLLLGDFTGHGLSASLGVTPVADIFYGMARKGFAVVDIVQEINHKLYSMLPAHMFLAASVVALYPDSKTLSVISCGLPEHFLVNALDGSYQTISAQNIPLGILGSMDLVIQNFSVGKNHHLYLLTDGVFEALNPEGVAFGSERIITALSRGKKEGLATLQSDLALHTQGLTAKDDSSIVELICNVDDVPWQMEENVPVSRTIQALSWKSAMVFDIDALRSVNPVPVMVNALMEIQGLQKYRQAIFLIVTELFANALDHGVLKLDSKLKSTPEGFAQFYQLREQRLQVLQQGWIRLSFDHRPIAGGGRLTIKVVDSGNGFDYSNEMLMNLQKNQAFFGRGIGLTRQLCSDLTYHGKGNRVTAVFDWLA